MPSRNTVKFYDTQSYYHIYNRGAGGMQIFKDAQDKNYFISLLARYITPIEDREEKDRQYPLYDVDINAFCIMSNHFHALVYIDQDLESITGLMRSVSTAYSMYFNKKHKTQGHVFQGVFKASKINDESYLAHITRYIHMNPRTYITYKWSSIGDYIGTAKQYDWIKTDAFLDMNHTRYREFLKEYEGKKKELEDIKSELAY